MRHDAAMTVAALARSRFAARFVHPSITDWADVRALVEAKPERHFPRPVGGAVASVRNNGPQLIESVEPAD